MKDGVVYARKDWSYARRLLSKARPDDSGCVIWFGAIITAGYGHLRIHGKSHYAHRMAYELFVAPIPRGLVIDHLCRVRSCINPSHMEAVTEMVNLTRGDAPLMAEFRAYEATGLCRDGHDRKRFRSKNGLCSECQRLGLYGGRPKNLIKRGGALAVL